MFNAVWLLLLIALLVLFSGPALASESPVSPETLKKIIKKLHSLHKPLEKPKPGDWLAEHPEPGQTFVEYLRCNPVTPKGKRHVIYIHPLGDFTATQRKIVTLTADFMGRYFNLPVKIKEDLPMSLVPEKARRTHPYLGMKQILTGYVLDDILKPRLPKDAAAYIAFTASKNAPNWPLWRTGPP